MATIYQNKKDGKIISFKFKVFLGRDENGKQIFKCKTWKPEKTMTESKLILQAEKEATVWEYQILKKLTIKNKDFHLRKLPLNLLLKIYGFLIK